MPRSLLRSCSSSPPVRLFAQDVRSVGGCDIRRGTLCASMNLNGADFGTNLAHSQFSRSELQGANLSGAILDEANFSYTQLQGADLSKAMMSRINLRGAKLNEAKLVDAKLRNANFQNADLGKADLSNADLTAADFTNARLVGTSLRGAKLQRANLRATSPPRHLLRRRGPGGRGFHQRLADQRRPQRREYRPGDLPACADGWLCRMSEVARHRIPAAAHHASGSILERL